MGIRVVVGEEAEVWRKVVGGIGWLRECRGRERDGGFWIGMREGGI